MKLSLKFLLSSPEVGAKFIGKCIYLSQLSNRLVFRPKSYETENLYLVKHLPACTRNRSEPTELEFAFGEVSYLDPRSRTSCEMAVSMEAGLKVDFRSFRSNYIVERMELVFNFRYWKLFPRLDAFLFCYEERRTSLYSFMNPLQIDVISIDATSSFGRVKVSSEEYWLTFRKEI